MSRRAELARLAAPAESLTLVRLDDRARALERWGLGRNSHYEMLANRHDFSWATSRNHANIPYTSVLEEHISYRTWIWIG